jgi:hypothetical protein
MVDEGGFGLDSFEYEQGMLDQRGGRNWEDGVYNEIG